MVRERGFTDNTVMQECLLLGEEVGELYKAIRKSQKMQVDAKSQVGMVEEELADIIIYICAIANRLDIDLAKALHDKEAVNQNRTWQSM